jgi:tetratricopeptide (TPR) repeat protein
MPVSFPVRHLLAAALLTVASGVGLLPGVRTARAEEDCALLIQQATEMVREAERQFDQGDSPKSKAAAIQALSLVERAFGRCPTSTQACLLGVFAAVFENDYTQGRIWLERYASLTAYGEQDPQLHYLRALVQARLVHRYDLALRSLERMHAINPRLDPQKRDRLYLDTLMAYGVELGKSGRYDDALRQFQTAALVARRTGQPRRELAARANAGIILSRDERFKEASDVFQALHKEAPENPVWSYQLGLALASQGRFPEAIEAYRRSIAMQATQALDPEIRDEVLRARLRLGNCLKLYSATLEPAQREKFLKQALDELKGYLEARPKDPLGHLYVGILLYEERDFAQAVGYLRTAFHLDPMCENVLRFLINAHSELTGPPKPGGAAPTAEEQAAWTAERAALQTDLDENKEARKTAIAAREAETGDELGGCQ